MLAEVIGALEGGVGSTGRCLCCVLVAGGFVEVGRWWAVW